MSLTPPGAASATGSTDSESDPDSESEPGRSDGRTEEAPALDAAPAQEESVQEDPPADADDEAVAPPHPPLYDQTAVPYDQTATEDALPTLADPPEASPPGPDDTAPIDAPVDPPVDAPIAHGGANGYDYGYQPGYGDAPVDELAYGSAPMYSDPAPVGDPSAYRDQFAYGGAPVPTDQLTYGIAPTYGEALVEAPVVEAPVVDAPVAEPQFGPAPVVEERVDPPYGEPPFGDAPFGWAPVGSPVGAPPWTQPEVPAGPVLLPPPTGTPGRGVRSITRPKAKRPPARKGRRVKRVVRRIELWSVLKVSLLFYFCMYLVALGAAVLLWGFAHSAGLIDNFESFMADIGFDDFQFFGETLFREVAIVGGVLVVAGALLTVLAVALVNLISEVTGGVRFVVIEIDVDEPPGERPSARQA